MGTVLGLQILLRIPIAVEQYNRVGCGEVDAEATGARAQQEETVVRVGVEGVDLRRALRCRHTAVDTADPPLRVQRLRPVFEQVQLPRELREDEGFVLREEPWEELRQKLHFARK